MILKWKWERQDEKNEQCNQTQGCVTSQRSALINFKLANARIIMLQLCLSWSCAY